MKKFKLDFRYFVASMLVMLLAYSVLAGKLQLIVPFDDPLNEMAFFVMTSITAILLLFASIRTKNC